MESLLIMLYALLTLNTAQINAVEADRNPDQEELQKLHETGDDIRDEIQAIRN